MCPGTHFQNIGKMICLAHTPGMLACWCVPEHTSETLTRWCAPARTSGTWARLFAPTGTFGTLARNCALACIFRMLARCFAWHTLLGHLLEVTRTGHSKVLWGGKDGMRRSITLKTLCIEFSLWKNTSRPKASLHLMNHMHRAVILAKKCWSNFWPMNALWISQLVLIRSPGISCSCDSFYPISTGWKHIVHCIYVMKPARSAGFSRIKKIPYQAPPTQLGPQKCTFGKNAFLGPKYQY